MSEIKKGSKVVVNYPTFTKPFKSTVEMEMNTPKGKVYLLKNGSIWDAKYVKLDEVTKLDRNTIRNIIKEELLKESVDKSIADSFTRYLMGNPKHAVLELQRNAGKFGFTMEMPGTKEYNDQYTEVYSKFLKLLNSLK